MNRLIELRFGDLFSAPQGSTLVHSCNAQGVWGAGIAKQFKQTFPQTFTSYQEYCFLSKENPTTSIVGTVHVNVENNYCIASLITSKFFGHQVDDPAQILQATQLSFKSLLDRLDDGSEVHMPRINSGLFRTPWADTEKCIEYLLQCSDKKVRCVVWINE
jgi:ADP-ribose 1''-phosphate phosphatase